MMFYWWKLLTKYVYNKTFYIIIIVLKNSIVKSKIENLNFKIESTILEVEKGLKRLPLQWG